MAEIRSRCDDGSGHILRGCRVLGYAPPNMERNTTDSTEERSTTRSSSTVGRTHNMMEAINAEDILCDRCEFWGGAAPWIGWDENKARMGAYAIPHKANLWAMETSNNNVVGIRFKDCLMDGWLLATRPGGEPKYIKFHQCSLRYWGMDGALACRTPYQTLEYIRCQIFEGSLAGWVGQSDVERGALYVGYTLLNNFRPFFHENGWWDIDNDIKHGNQFTCASQQVWHETGSTGQQQEFWYNCTSIGSHNHRNSQATKAASSPPPSSSSTAVVQKGGGAFIFPNANNKWQTAWWSRNNILAVYPNASTGYSDGGTGGPSGDSHVAIILAPKSHGQWNRWRHQLLNEL